MVLGTYFAGLTVLLQYWARQLAFCGRSKARSESPWSEGRKMAFSLFVLISSIAALAYWIRSIFQIVTVSPRKS